MQSWASDFESKHKVYYTGDDEKLITTDEAEQIVADFRPTIVHTHFEGYDIPMYNAIQKVDKQIREVWHMHDHLSLHPHPLKAIIVAMSHFKHYGKPMIHSVLWGGVKPSVIAVDSHEKLFAKWFRLGSAANEVVIPNGIDVTRIGKSDFLQHKPFTFLAFSGRNIQKRIDLLLDAAEELTHEGNNLKILLTNGVDTKQVVSSKYETLPKWLNIIGQTDDINSLFSKADCFVSSSASETFSFAIAEASIYGLPIIQSDIPGTMWNAHNPSTFLFKTENVKDLKRSMLEVMNASKDSLMQKCIETRNTNVRNYSLSAWCDKVSDFYQKL
jgi:glycosyltransferase involved in cell wall biosynthesis